MFQKSNFLVRNANDRPGTLQLETSQRPSTSCSSSSFNFYYFIFYFFYVSFVPLRFLLFGQPISGDRCKHVTFLLIFAVNFARFRWLSFVSHRVINANASDLLINPFVMARLIKFSFFGFDGRLILFCLFVCLFFNRIYC